MEQLKMIFDGENMVEIYKYQKIDRLKEVLCEKCRGKYRENEEEKIK